MITTRFFGSFSRLGADVVRDEAAAIESFLGLVRRVGIGECLRSESRGDGRRVGVWTAAACMVVVVTVIGERGERESDDIEVKKKRMTVESLGWLTESTIMPKKHRAIAGVGASSILELKAQLYKSQEETKKSKEISGSDVDFHRAKKFLTPHDPFSFKNSGVEARAHKDKLELKAANDGTDSYAALERKAELYDKLVRGDLPDDEDQEKYCVDFFRKNLDQDESQQVKSRDLAAQPPGTEYDEGDPSTLFDKKPVGPGRMVDGALDSDEHKRFVREVHQEANQAREKATELKLRRQEQATSRREKLRQAYLRKQLEKVKTASKTEQT